jgi:hypothetical protein
VKIEPQRSPPAGVTVERADSLLSIGSIFAGNAERQKNDSIFWDNGGTRRRIENNNDSLK